MTTNQIMEMAETNGLAVAPKEMVLDVLYISMANNLIQEHLVKVFEKVFEDHPVVPVPPLQNGETVSVEDTLAMCVEISNNIIYGSQRILKLEMPVLSDMVQELALLKGSGAEPYQLTNIQTEIDYRIEIIAKSKAIMEIADNYFERKNTP